jgi:sulfide dehydrogenase cytochrome subunit
MIRDRVFRTAALFVSAIGFVLGAAPAALAADGATIVEQQCSICHGKDGASGDSSIPVIGGYSVKYIVESIKNFKSKLRPCAEVTVQSGSKKGTRSDMCKVVAELSAADAEAAARYLASKPFVRVKQPFDAGKAARGEPVYKKNCKTCHENNGSSRDEDNGILAGQWTPYLKAQLTSFRAGKRVMDEKMEFRLVKVRPDEEEALLNFFASQQ